MPPLNKLLAARPGGKISIIVEDLTRHSPLPRILAVIARELEHARIGDKNVEIVFATGTHPPLTAQEAAGKIGAELAGRFAWRSNECKDRKAYHRVGRVGSRQADLDLWIDRKVAQADLRIIVSSVSPHLQAGFGGGYKMFLPGCARQDTIRRLHLMGVPRSPRQQVGQSHEVNRMRALIDAAGRPWTGTRRQLRRAVRSGRPGPALDDRDRRRAGRSATAGQDLRTGCGAIMDGRPTWLSPGPPRAISTFTRASSPW